MLNFAQGRGDFACWVHRPIQKSFELVFCSSAVFGELPDAVCPAFNDGSILRTAGIDDITEISKGCGIFFVEQSASSYFADSVVDDGFGAAVWFRIVYPAQYRTYAHGKSTRFCGGVPTSAGMPIITRGSASQDDANASRRKSRIGRKRNIVKSE
ncbi:hypothetical protein HG530_011443 [Fusarium avenaceum]|nr:hypothetical protein HG530_011443 [Fusarium avenaceum]